MDFGGLAWPKFNLLLAVIFGLAHELLTRHMLLDDLANAFCRLLITQTTDDHLYMRASVIFVGAVRPALQHISKKVDTVSSIPHTHR